VADFFLQHYHGKDSKKIFFPRFDSLQITDTYRSADTQCRSLTLSRFFGSVQKRIEKITDTEFSSKLG
jgi:hypothetical protein